MQPLIESDPSVRPGVAASKSEQATGKRFSWKVRSRIVPALVLVLLLAIVVPPFINIGRFRRSIVRSISAGLGRPVEASAVELRLFPLPGFVLHNLTIAEDPAYGAEPVMTAQTVTAVLRASTLWHRRVEIATLRFDTPSVNLVRNAEGHWNFESLLKNSPVLHRPKSAASALPMPFPYVEASNARINFKFGAEKLPFSLEQASLALWKESPHDWRMRIRARPVRTDLTVEDDGEIRGQGELRTGGLLMNAQVRAGMEWRRVQLGEISRLLRGQDDGWRGKVDWTAHGQGTLSDLTVASDIGIEDFRRTEFIPAAEMDLSAHCQGRYARDHPHLDAVACDMPLGDGQMSIRGRFHGSSAADEDSSAFQLALHQIPAAFFLDLLQHVHPGVSADASASGVVNGSADCDLPRWDSPQNCRGEFRSANLRVRLPGLTHSLPISPLVLVSPGSSVDNRTVWNLQPIRVSLGGVTPVTIAGAVTAAGSSVHIAGPVDLREMMRLAQSLRIPVISGEMQSIRGSAQLALTVQSEWLPLSTLASAINIGNGLPGEQASGSVAPRTSLWLGDLEIHGARLKLAVLPVPVHLSSARVNLLPGRVEWNALDGSFAHIPFDGSIQWQTPCPAAGSSCGRRFNLHTAALNVGHLETVLRGESSSLLGFHPPWSPSLPGLPEISGMLRADLITAGRLSVKNAILKVQLQEQHAELLSLSGRMFGGTLSGTGRDIGILPAAGATVQESAGSVNWGNGPPEYTLRAQLQNVQPNRVAAIWDEHWGCGSAELQVNLSTHGWKAADLAQNATGRFALNWQDGSLTSGRTKPHADEKLGPNTIMLGDFQDWRAAGQIRSGRLLLESSRLIPRKVVRSAAREPESSSDTVQSVTGSVSFNRVLNLKLEPSGISVTGSLSNPVVSHGPRSSAAIRQ